jgi:hypothetical protein
METYFVRRRGIAGNANQLDAALTRLRFFEERSAGLQVRWLHSYALREADGRLGLGCVLESDSFDALREHARATRLPAEEIGRIAATHVVHAFEPRLAYLIRRRKGWESAAELDRAAASCRRTEGDLAHRVRWLRSYAIHEDDGSFGTFCLYQGVDEHALGEHARRFGIPAGEITAVLGRVVCRELPRNLATVVDVD